MEVSDFLSLCQRSGIQNGDTHVGFFANAVSLSVYKEAPLAAWLFR
jgi:hypothetical protein